MAYFGRRPNDGEATIILEGKEIAVVFGKDDARAGRLAGYHPAHPGVPGLESLFPLVLPDGQGQNAGRGFIDFFLAQLAFFHRLQDFDRPLFGSHRHLEVESSCMVGYRLGRTAPVAHDAAVETPCPFDEVF